MRGELASYARSGAWSVVAQAIHLVGALAVSIVVVRALSERDWGILSEVRQLTALATVVAGLALERTALRFIPEIVERGGGHAAARFFWGTLALRVAVWLPVMGLTLLLGPQLDRWFHVPLAGLTNIGVATALVFSVYNHVRGCATARFATRTVAMATAGGSIVTLVGTVWALGEGYGVAGVLIAAAVGMAVASIWMLPAAVQRGAPAGEPGWSLSRQRFVAFALPFAGIALLNFVVHSATEVLFLGHFHGPELAGFFLLGFSFAQRLIDFLPLALWEVSMAGFSQIAVRDPEKLPNAMYAYLILLYVVLAPLAAMGVAFSPSIIRLMYGEAMLPSAMVSQAYFVTAAYGALGAPVGMIVYARERTARALLAYVAFAAVNLVLDLTLIPRFELWGAIVALAAAKLLAVGLMAWIAWREVPALRVPWSFLIRVCLASAPVTLWLLVQARWPAVWQVALGAVAAGLVLLLGFRLWRVVGPEEAHLIRETKLPLGNVAVRLLTIGSRNG